ncbi:hypothetical protein BV25DRAFT_1795107 [Artomyces pyxidatus]|uniref:Uncharacterized protein n=1 Tax=Artomyces pyxidatus TaxID=48021 RepID=A0ACB8TFT2_9AGAM|nr:hypothetical protein BV25DRAFT_1795107 [Artomyces pyxidatus]
MYRALPVARQATSSGRRALVRLSRRRLVTEAAETPVASPLPPAKKSHVLRKVVLYTSAVTATFYVGSAFVSYHNPRYHAFFIDTVPFGPAVLEFGENRNWDTLTVSDVVVSTYDGAMSAYRFVRKQLGSTADEVSDKAHDAKSAVSAKVKAAKSTAEASAEETKGRARKLSDALKTEVKASTEKVHEQGLKAAAISKHRADQFSEGVEDLIRKAEAALLHKPLDSQPEATTTPEQPTPEIPDALGPRHNEIELMTSEFHEAHTSSKARNDVYDAPLPLGFEPPPGFSRPKPPPPKPEPEPLEPLPLVAPVVAELHSSEPVLTHLATTIDNLASFLNTNPAAATKARDVLDTAKVDLTELAENFEKVKEEEQRKLEQQLDEQTRQYTLQLLELELASQDKLDSQEADFRTFYEEERARFAKAYREKLETELRTQSEIINERLKEEVVAQGIELQRRWIREIKVRVEQERGGRLAKLDELAANLKRLERVALDNSSYLDENLRIHSLWSAIRALHHAVDAPARKPFRDELRVLRHIAAAKDDTVVSAALDSLEASDAPDVGVEPLADLTSWFSTSVVPRVSRVALVPDQNAGVLSHLASHVFSSFAFRRQGLVPGDDVMSVLSRAEYYLNEKDLDGAARELNQLKGTAKVLLKDWLEAARRRLEVEQALEVVQTQATLASLLVL